MILNIQNKQWLWLATMAAATMLLWLFSIVSSSQAQIEPERPQATVGSGLGFSGASTSNDLVIFDMATGTANANTINLLPEGQYPYDATMNPAGDQVWLPGASGEGLIVVDAHTPAIVQRISNLGDYPVDVVFSEDGQLAYVSSRNTADDIQIIDTTTYIIVGSIPVPDYFLGTGKMRTNHCNGDLYAVNWFDDRFFVINPISQTVTMDMSFGSSLWDLTIDPTAATLYIADRGTPDAVHVFDIATLTTTTSIPVGTDPWGIDITPDGRYVLVANEDSHDVSVIDTATNAVTTTIFLAADADPRDIDINAAGTLAYVTSGAIDDLDPDGVYEIDLATFQVVDIIYSPAGGGSNTNVVAVAPDFASLDPIASFTATTPVVAGTSVQFFDASSNNPTAWEWDFGDGLGNSTEQNPTYTYANAGTYTVALTIENDCGISSSQATVTVKQPPHSDIYLSLIQNNVFQCFQEEKEDNDTYGQANNPICLGQVVTGLPDDQWDFFRFQTNSAGTISVNLTNYSGAGGQLHLYYESSSNRVAEATAAPYIINYSGQPGTYGVAVFTESGFNNSPYSLVVNVP